jgi:hypothetical protein
MLDNLFLKITNDAISNDARQGLHLLVYYVKIKYERLLSQ